ncbi:hypothetical protein K443DRAFT_162066 [Laccaria amethystina LaAM-08-1]|uniref:Uncharacterized protein n=1 Tax=Laccaria amethystina LaAM-08-1 TaxID=1095629 RepID=A0A0C9XPV4_9AGAR|nr:hypothetical protein K443DRAFT_162066 [Laccaria amethystina LaAM-08-1]
MSCARGKYSRQIGLVTFYVVAQEHDLIPEVILWCTLVSRKPRSVSTPIFSFVPFIGPFFYTGVSSCA